MTSLDNIGIITIHSKVLVLVVKHWYLLLVLLAILLALVFCHVKYDKILAFCLLAFLVLLAWSVMMTGLDTIGIIAIDSIFH